MGIPRWVGTIDDIVLKMSLEHETTSKKYPTCSGGIGWGIDRWVGTIDHIVLKMSLEHETTP